MLKYPAMVATLIFSVSLLFLSLQGQMKTIVSPVTTSPVSMDKPFPFITSIDTMKESRDTETMQLSDARIAQHVSLAASLHTTHITVDTNWDYVEYLKRWVKAIHSSGNHVWLRGHPDKWENNNGARGIMTPPEYLAYERSFLLQNADIFQPGDIIDTCSEPELGHYWKAMYPKWTSTTTKEYNQFLRDSITTADQALTQKGISGVITTLHSTNAWMAIHRLETETIKKMGVVTIDSYPDQYTLSPLDAVNARMAEITAVHDAVHVPVVLGEIGYSNKINVSDQLQSDVLQAEFSALENIKYIAGINYWVGAGGEGHGGFTNIFTRTNGMWVKRPAANELDALYQYELH